MEWLPFDHAPPAGYPRRSAWNRGVAPLSDAILARWELTPEAIVSGGSASIVMRVRRADGSPAVLKVSYPHEEARFEAVGLGALGPQLACRVLLQHTADWALLLEELSPGVSLGESVLRQELSIADAAAVAAGLRARVGATPVPRGVPTLEALTARYAADATASTLEHADVIAQLGVAGLVGDAVRLLGGEALAHPLERELLHGDFNPSNILAAGPAAHGWRLIDPKTAVGDPASDLWQLVAQLGDPLDGPDPEAQFAATLAAVAHASGVDADRIARWGFARTGLNVVWAVADGDSWEAPIQARALTAWAALLA
jgi:streptomycin 6-kinase